jgi:hypothetical protein
VYLQFTWEVGLPPSPVEFSFHHHFSKVAGWMPPLLPSPASLFIYSSMKDCHSLPLRLSGYPALFIMCIFFVVVVYFSVFWVFFLFFP